MGLNMPNWDNMNPTVLCHECSHTARSHFEVNQANPWKSKTRPCPVVPFGYGDVKCGCEVYMVEIAPWS